MSTQSLKENIAIVASKNKLGFEISYNIEGVRKIDGNLVLNGWIVDPSGKLDLVVLRFSRYGKPVDFKKLIVRFPRPDVNVAFKESNATIETHYGFVGICHDKLINEIDSVGIVFVASNGNAYAESCQIKDVSNSMRGIQDLIGIVPGQGMTAELCEKYYQPLFDSLINQTFNHDLIADLSYPGNNLKTVDISLSIIIPLHGKTRFEGVQIPALAALRRKNLEVILAVDDPSILSVVTANARRLARLYGFQVRVLAADRNLGFAGINNFAAAKACGDKLLFLNSDCFISSMAGIDKGMRWLDSDSNAGAVGFRLLYPDRSIQHDGMDVGIWNDDENFLLNEHPRRGIPIDLVGETVEDDRCGMVTAACLLTTRKNFEQVGGFDCSYYRGDFEDSDLCLKYIENDLRLGIVRDDGIFHLERQTISAQDGGVRQRITLVNSYIYTKKWQDRLKSDIPVLEVI